VPPTAKPAAPPEMHRWAAAQLRAFLAWSRENSDLHAAWHGAGHAGMRRGELLSLRWRDVDLDAGTIAIRRSTGLVRNKGQGFAVQDGDPKTERSRRVIDIDAGTARCGPATKSRPPRNLRPQGPGGMTRMSPHSGRSPL
jgi:integrase